MPSISQDNARMFERQREYSDRGYFGLKAFSHERAVYMHREAA